MSAVRALANDPDREVRRAAYEAELAAWETVAVPLAAALNGIKGYQGVLQPPPRLRGRRRADAAGQQHRPRDAGRHAAGMRRESFPDFRRYLRAKARALGLERLAWYDLNAPVGEGGRVYYLAGGRGVHPRAVRPLLRRGWPLSRTRSFRERWIDAEPRAGKEGGAFCTALRPGKSRILMNYDGSLQQRQHAGARAGPRLPQPEPGARARPSRADALDPGRDRQHLLRDARLRGRPGRHAPAAERLALLEASLQRDLLVVVDIHSRFLFEQARLRAPRAGAS